MYLRGRAVCTINDIPTRIIAADARHGVNLPICVGSITMPLPLPGHIMETAVEGLLSPVTVQMGFDQTVIRPRFIGHVIGDSMKIDQRTKTATFDLQGNAARLARPFGERIDFGPNMPLKVIWEAYCYWMGMPAWQVDDMTYPDGITPILLGGNPDIDYGAFVVPGDVNILDYLGRLTRRFGYRAFETPGSFRVQRVSGLPVGSVHESFTLGQEGYRWERRQTVSNVANDFQVEGPTFTDADGVSIPVRSFAKSVEPSPYITGGFRTEQISDRDLVRYDLAHAVRNVAEIDLSEPENVVDWQFRGQADLYPGDVVETTVPDFGVAGRRWLMEITEEFKEDAYLASYAAWSGMGTALAAGTDKVEIPVPGVWHIGDEYLSHYRVPNPSRGPIEIPFTVPEKFTSFAVRGLGHGINSHMMGGANTESKVSKIEVWQGGDKAVGTADLPVMDENLSRRFPYNATSPILAEDGTYVNPDFFWSKFRMPVPGRLEPGQAVLKIVPGEHKDLSDWYKLDDFEIKDVVLECYGSGTPLYERAP